VNILIGALLVGAAAGISFTPLFRSSRWNFQARQLARRYGLHLPETIEHRVAGLLRRQYLISILLFQTLLVCRPSRCQRGTPGSANA
jgi:hypothetical protein